MDTVGNIQFAKSIFKGIVKTAFFVEYKGNLNEAFPFTSLRATKDPYLIIRDLLNRNNYLLFNLSSVMI